MPGQPSVDLPVSPPAAPVACSQASWVGVLMLDTRFRRWPRDIGQCDGLPFAVRHRRVAHASVDRVVGRSALPVDLRQAFIAAGRLLVEEGAALITTSCGFLYREQATLSRALPVPVVTSSLIALERLHAQHGATGPIGVLTFDAAALGSIELGDGTRCPVQGLARDGHFRAVVQGRCDWPDSARLCEESVAAARRLAEREPAAVVLECTNLAPWREAIQAVLGVPVIDLIDVIGCTLSVPDPQRSARNRSR